MKKIQWITVTQFQAQYFGAGSAPARNTVIRMIEDKEIPGQRMGKKYYINQTAWDAAHAPQHPEVDPLVQMVMNG